VSGIVGDICLQLSDVGILKKFALKLVQTTRVSVVRESENKGLSDGARRTGHPDQGRSHSNRLEESRVLGCRLVDHTKQVERWYGLLLVMLLRDSFEEELENVD
jgi:DNA-directed RNA polymerase beta' subunit